ncbi:MAG: hypothetical protein IJO27_03175 [Bacilli bacterium]|nr:hypothetical protein [Bacilli bacterium]
MFRRIIDGIFSPSEVASYRNDRKLVTFGVFMIFALLLMVPSLIAVFITKPFDYNQKVAIRNAFFNSTEIPYVINSGKLEFVGTTEKPQYYVNVDDLGMTVVFTTQEDIIVEKEMLDTIIIFRSDSVYLYNSLESFKLLNYYEYNNCTNLDFRLARNDDRLFWDQAFSVVYEVIDNFKELFTSITIGFIVVQSIVMVLIVTTILTLFNRLGSNNIYKFGTHWKLMLYYMGPFILGYIFAVLFNIALLEYVGLIVTLIYSFKINQIHFKKGE